MSLGIYESTGGAGVGAPGLYPARLRGACGTGGSSQGWLYARHHHTPVHLLGPATLLLDISKSTNSKSNLLATSVHPWN